MGNNNPKVSIIMGIYNCENTLSESIESILNQTYENWEFIMCDDNSTDNTFQVAMKYANKYPDKIKLIRNNMNLTLGPTLNKCIELVTGKYIARQDGDDISHEQRLEKQVKFLKKNQQYDLVGTSMISFDSNGIYGKRNLKQYPKSKDLMRGTTFSHATIMIKTDVIKELKGYSENLKHKRVEDYELWYRFFEKEFKGINLNEPLYYVREDREAYSRRTFKARLNEVIVMYEGRRRLGLPFKYSLYIIKPIIATLTPSKILMNYHRKKFNNNLKQINHN